MTLAIGERWFDFARIDDGITLIWEPHVDPFIRCNIWHVRGRDRDMMVDSGLGIASLREAARDLLDKPLAAVATHSHYDHVGGFHEFEERIAHRCEEQELAAPNNFASLESADLGDPVVEAVRASGYELPETLVTAVPHEGFYIADSRVRPAPATRLVDEGDVIDLGDRVFEVLHLPGHSPGSIGLWEARSGILFSGDAVYDGPLLDGLPGSEIARYLETMKRLRELPVTVVHAGHEDSFGRDRLRELADAYLRARS
ncbi:MAG: MBL fold metallo-hydrolase [Kiloniellales bacterium]|nr:MBL fold metallo-hydrolase [Kiloniellales bacterium]